MTGAVAIGSKEHTSGKYRRGPTGGERVSYCEHPEKGRTQDLALFPPKSQLGKRGKVRVALFGTVREETQSPSPSNLFSPKERRAQGSESFPIAKTKKQKRVL